MNLPALTLLLLAVGSAGWSAAEVGMAPGSPLPGAAAQIRAVTPPQAGSPSPCGKGPSEKVVLRAPRIDPTAMPPDDRARIEQAVVEEWLTRMAAAGVPRDLLDRTLRMPKRTYELSEHDRLRAGCIAV